MQALNSENERVMHPARSTAIDTEADELSAVLTKYSVSWPEFLDAIERFCGVQGWIVEYESVDDESCAIFFQPDGQIRHE